MQRTVQLSTAFILTYHQRKTYKAREAQQTADIWTGRDELIACDDTLELEAEANE